MAPDGRSAGRRRNEPQSLRRLLDPEDHGSLEDTTLHPQRRDLLAQLLELLTLIAGQATALAGGSRLRYPVPERALVHPEIPGYLRDRLPGLLNDPDRSVLELLTEPLPVLCHENSLIAGASTTMGEPHPVFFQDALEFSGFELLKGTGVGVAALQFF